MDGAYSTFEGVILMIESANSLATACAFVRELDRFANWTLLGFEYAVSASLHRIKRAEEVTAPSATV
jgi:hypothetical protein